MTAGWIPVWYHNAIIYVHDKCFFMGIGFKSKYINTNKNNEEINKQLEVEA